MVSMRTPKSTSHKHTLLSEDWEASLIPSGEKTTEQTDELWPSRADPMAVHVSISDKHTVLSRDAEAHSLPSGEKTTE